MATAQVDARFEDIECHRPNGKDSQRMEEINGLRWIHVTLLARSGRLVERLRKDLRVGGQTPFSEGLLPSSTRPTHTAAPVFEHASVCDRVAQFQVGVDTKEEQKKRAEDGQDRLLRLFTLLLEQTAGEGRSESLEDSDTGPRCARWSRLNEGRRQLSVTLTAQVNVPRLWVTGSADAVMKA